jgi:MYXO-CTERM domain-containing protein
MSGASRGFKVSGFALVASMAAAMTSSNANAFKPIHTPEQREASRVRTAAHPEGGFTNCTHYPGGSPTAVSCAMSYEGGQVISNVQVVPVFWTYGGQTVDSTVTAWAPPYISALVDSPFLDLLSEYGTTSQGGQQSVTRGTTLAARTITPTVATAATVPDADIAKELAAQVKAGKLPAVTNDANGNPNTLYVLFFAPGNTITMGSGSNASTSCVAFCGYHGSGTPTAGGPTYVYAVIPDLSVIQTYALPDGGSVTEPCGYGCAYDAPAKPEVDWFNGTISHEIAESVSDPINFGGWYDQSNTAYACAGSESQNQPGGGEIGDVCVGFWDDQYGQGECEDTVTVPGTNVAAQQMWSNALNGCYVANSGLTAKCPPGGCVDGGAGPIAPSFDAGGGGGSDASTGGDDAAAGDDGGGTDDASTAEDSATGTPVQDSGGPVTIGGDSGSPTGGDGDGGGGGGGGAGDDAGTAGAPGSSSGCSCTNAASTTSSSFALGGALMAMAALVRRRARRKA